MNRIDEVKAQEHLTTANELVEKLRMLADFITTPDNALHLSVERTFREAAAELAAKDAEIARLTARVGALEQAIELTGCVFCVHTNNFESPCSCCMTEGFGSANGRKWQFDEARFAGNAEEVGK